MLPRFILASFFSLLPLSPAAASVLFADDFESGLKDWGLNNEVSGTISITSAGCPSNTQCVRIENSDVNSFVYIGRRFAVRSPGSMLFKAKLRVPVLKKGSEFFHVAKFQAAIIRDGREINWPNSDIYSPVSGWVSKSFKAAGLRNGDEVFIRIGLQNAAGTVEVDDVQVIFTKE